MAINRVWRVRGLITLVLLAVFQPTQASVSAVQTLCMPAGYTLGYFNGMWNTEKNARKGLQSLLDVTPSQYNGAPITGQVLYNHTGCGRAGSSCLEDIAEVFEQRAQELDSTGTLAGHLEYFWESLGDAANFTSTIQNLFQGAEAIFADLQAKVIAQIAVSIASTVSNDPLTAADYAAQNAQLDTLASKGQVLLLVAHSQGNLFLNQAYDHIVPSVGPNRVVAVQIAPASPTLRGPYVLANIDLVINALRIQGNSTVPANNITLPVSATDLTGHSLTGTYLDTARPARVQVVNLLNSGLASLAAPISSNAAQAFTVSLTWTGSGSQHMYVYEPDGMEVYYAAKQGDTGYLNTSNPVGVGSEQYVVTCNSSIMQTGTYRVAIDNYQGNNAGIAAIAVATPEAGTVITSNTIVNSVLRLTNNTDPLTVYNINVSKDAVTGIFSMSVNWVLY